MKNKVLICLSVLFGIIFFSNCTVQDKKELNVSSSSNVEASVKKSLNIGNSYVWKKSKEGTAYIWTNVLNEFTWSGSISGKFANGKGTIQYYEGGQTFTSEYLDLLYGAKESLYRITGDSGNKYLGDYKINTYIPNGLGVLIKASGDVYAGEFSDGKINGYAARFTDNLIAYEGNFKNNLYSGTGTLYNKGKIYYKGDFVDGKKSGSGTEFIDDATFIGNFKDDKRDGVFEIRKQDIIRLVSYDYGVPDLVNCKEYFPDGTMWEGPLSENFVRTGTGKTTTSDGLVNFETRSNGELLGYQTIKTANGSTYTGEFLNGVRNGYGELIQQNGIRYYGLWKNDKPSGYGEWIYDDDWYYDGEWKDGLFNGEGTYAFPGFVYEGRWSNGKKSGNGILTCESFTYEGNWLNDELNGEGSILYSDGSYYEGNWKNSKKNGYGEYFWPDGSSYSGDWTEDFPNGDCYIVFSNGDIYSGDVESAIENNTVLTCYSGLGSYIFADGERYEGTFIENKKSGFGTYYFTDGNIYEGEFNNDKPNGKGKFFFSDGTYYHGDFADGNFTGKGSLYIPEDDSYIIFTSELWTNSQNNIPNYGSMLFPNGDEFVGSFVNGNPSNGTWTTKEERIRIEQQKLQEKYDVETLEHTRFEEFAKKHENGLKKFLKISRNVVTAVNIASNIVSGTTAKIAIVVPNNMVVGGINTVSKAVSRICDFVDAGLAATDAAVNTAIYNYDKKEAIKNLDEKRIVELKGEWKKAMISDAITTAITVGIAAGDAVREGINAKKILASSPDIADALKALKTAEPMADVAKSSKIGNALLRGVVELAYPGIGATLVRQWGDDAAKMIFKYGDNAITTLTKGGKLITEIAKKSSEKVLKEVLQNTDDAIRIFSKNADKFDDVVKVLEKLGNEGFKKIQKYGDNFVSVVANHGDEAVDLISKLGRNNGRIAVKVITEQGDDALKALTNVVKNDPSNLNKAIKYLDAFETSGLDKLKKWNGKIPEEITFKVIATEKKRVISSIKIITEEILAKPGLKLTAKELDNVMANPRLLRKLVYDATGKRFNEGFQEFFIRLSKESPEQMKKLWGSSYVKNFIKNNGIRAGGVHEWLMCSNLLDFLVNPKWGNDGPYLVNAMTELVQNTQNVRFKIGGAHGAEWSGTFHSNLLQTITNCNSASEIYERVRIFAKEVLTTDSYEEFLEILTTVLNT